MAEKIRISGQGLQELGKEAVARKIAEVEGRTERDLPRIRQRISGPSRIIR